MAGTANKEPQSSCSLFFDLDEFPENTLKAFNDYVELFELRYNAASRSTKGLIGFCTRKMEDCQCNRAKSKSTTNLRSI